MELAEIKKCKNVSYQCSLPCLEKLNYCIQHILQDPKAPYKPCNYIYPNSKQCGKAKFVEESNDTNYSTYCIEHSRQSQIEKTKSSIGNFKHMESTEILTHNLTHHVKIDKGKPQSTTKIPPFDDDEEVDVVTPAIDPFVDINASEINNRGKNILDYASDSSTDDDAVTTLNNTWKCHEMDNSEDESDDSSDEDLLKHAGVYTIDELVTISKQKMEKLQSLYVDQFQRLQYVLKEKRKVYLQDLKKEKESLCNIHDQPKNSPKERKLYDNLKALNRYHRRYGPEALLHRQYREKRQKQVEFQVTAPIPIPKNIAKCIFSEGGVKCNERSIPCCRYCRKHIMEDKKQILFKTCNIEKSGIVCQEPVVAIFEDATCVLHTTLPSPRVYMKRKYESETEDEEDHHQISLNEIKKETSGDITTTDQEPEISNAGNEVKIESTSTIPDEVIVE